MRRAAVEAVLAAGLSERHACQLIGQPRSTERYRSIREPQQELRERIHVLATSWMRRGYRFMTILLQRDGLRINHKRVYRIYTEECLGVRRRRRRRKQMAQSRKPASPPTRLNECWGMDFVSDSLVNGRRIRILNILDGLSREDLDGPIDTSITAEGVTEALDHIAMEQGAYPCRLIVDNGPEFRSRALDAWAYEHEVQLDFIDPGKPMQNPITESYNGRMRDECLNQNWWVNLEQAQKGIRAWRKIYNTQRPHGSLGKRTPSEYAAHVRTLNSEDVST